MDEFNEELYYKLRKELMDRGVDEYDASITAEKVACIGCETMRDALNAMYSNESSINFS